MEHLAEDENVVLAGGKENQKSPYREGAQSLLVKQAMHVIAQSHSSLAVSLTELNLDFHGQCAKHGLTAE